MSRNKATGTRWESACVQALVDAGGGDATKFGGESE